MYSVFLDSGRWVDINPQSKKLKWNNLLQHNTSCPWPFHLKVGRDKGGGRFLLFLKRILLADHMNVSPIQKIKLNKNKSISLTKVQVQSFHTSLSVNSLGQRNFNWEPRLVFFFLILLFFTPLETHYAKTRMPDVSDRHCTTCNTCQTPVWTVRRERRCLSDA